MSIDFHLGHRCPHLVVEEPVNIGSDNVSLVTKAPVASTTVLRVLANNAYYIPTNGLYSQAILYGSESGPFQIEGCISENGASVDANVVTVTSSSESKTFSLPIGNRVTTDALIRVFRAQFVDIIVTNENGYLVFTDVASIGPESRITVSGRGRDSIGFSGQWKAKGQEVYPPWRLSSRADILPMVNRGPYIFDHARYVQFTHPVKLHPTFKVTYSTPPERCPRCRATFIENDWRFDIEGEIITVENENLLYQAALKILLTRRGSNPYHTPYGSQIMERIGSKAVGAVAQSIQEDVRTALGRMQSLQKQQAKYQRVSLKERLYSIMSVEVYPHETDQTAFLVDVIVSNGTAEPIQLSVVFSVPGAVALAGTNNLTLGLESTGLTVAESREVFNR